MIQVQLEIKVCTILSCTRMMIKQSQLPPREHLLFKDHNWVDSEQDDTYFMQAMVLHLNKEN